MRKQQRIPKEPTINKMLTALLDLQVRILHGNDVSSTYFSKKYGISGSFTKILRNTGILKVIRKESHAYIYEWVGNNPDRDMAIAVIIDSNKRTKKVSPKDAAISYAESLRERDRKQQEIAEATKKVVNEEANVKEIVHKQAHILPQPDQPIYTVTKEEPDVLTITTVTYYFFKWLKIKRVVIHTKGK